MIYGETFDYLFAQLAGSQNGQLERRLRDYQRKRLRRAQLALSLRAYFLEATWINVTGLAGEEIVANTQPVTEPLFVLDGAIRQSTVTGQDTDTHNFEIWLRRTAGDSRVQLSQSYIKDEHLLTPAQSAIKQVAMTLGVGVTNILGQGGMWPLTWPVPLTLAPNELLQLKTRVLAGGVTANRRSFVQFRALHVDKEPDDKVLAELRDYINSHELQRPVYLSMTTPGFHSIAFPGTGANQRTLAQTREVSEPVLVLGYSMLTARNQLRGTTADPRWRLTASNGYSFSKEEIDCNTFGFAGPGCFYNAFAHPFLLPKGSSLSASFSARNNVANAVEQLENYVFFRCVTL